MTLVRSVKNARCISSMSKRDYSHILPALADKFAEAELIIAIDGRDPRMPNHWQWGEISARAMAKALVNDGDYILTALTAQAIADFGVTPDFIQRVCAIAEEL